jgi:peptidoglycan/LPS O-acetylase OafA/YrhL
MRALEPELVAHTRSRVFGLDVLRAAAVISVVFAHGFVVLYPHFHDWLGFFGFIGFYGVELFFVLSGFLIGQILLRSGASIGEPRMLLLFYVRRRFRTLPLFLLFLGVNVLIEYRLRHHALTMKEIVDHGFSYKILRLSKSRFSLNHGVWRLKSGFTYFSRQY